MRRTVRKAFSWRRGDCYRRSRFIHDKGEGRYRDIEYRLHIRGHVTGAHDERVAAIVIEFGIESAGRREGKEGGVGRKGGDWNEIRIGLRTDRKIVGRVHP